MILKNKYFQVGLLSSAIIIGSLMSGCTSTGSEGSTTSTASQPAGSSSIQSPATSPVGQPKLGSSNLPAKPTGTLDQQLPDNQTQSDQFSDTLAKVATILDIDEQKLEDAFTQVRATLGDKWVSSPQIGPNVPAIPDGTTRPVPTVTNVPVSPDGTAIPVPSGTPGQAPRVAIQPGMSAELLAEVANILGIDQQKLDDAFNQVITQK
jgi:hypothetical protein